MITSVEKGNIERSGTFEEHHSRIAQNAEMFDILSNKLYADAEIAVLRELASNCYDAHVEVGKKDVPFIVELPNRFTPHLRFRDYGPGIKDEDMVRVYKDFGESTRRGDNDSIGQMGLGAKSPLSISDSFIISSFYNGTKTTYNFYKNESNLPTLAKLLSEPSTEPSGLEVLIHFTKDKYPDLNRKAQDVFRWFKVKPDIKPPITFPSTPKMYEGKDFYLYSRGYEEGHFIIMGNVAYKIKKVLSHQKIGVVGVRYPEEKELRPKWLENLGLVIEVPIGTVDIVPSREDLQYTKKTKTFLENKIIEIVHEVSKSVKDKVDKAKSKYEAIFILSESNQYGIDEIVWNGHLIKNSAISLAAYCRTGRRAGKSKIEIKEYCKYNKRWQKNNWMNHHMPFKFYFDDMEKGGFAAVQRTTDGGWFFRILKDDQKQPLATKQELIDILGINESDFILTSSLPKLQIVRTARGVSTKIQKFIVPKTHYGNYHTEPRKNKWWEDAVVQATDAIHFFDLKEFSIVVNKNEYSTNKIQPIIDWLQYFNLIPGGTQLYGVRGTVSEKMKKGWVNCTKLFEDNYDKLYLSEGVEQMKIDNNSTFYNATTLKKVNTINTVLLRHLDEWERMQKRRIKNERALTIFNNLPIIKGDLVGRNFDEELKEILKKWPLVQYIPHELWNNPEVTEYLNQEKI